jgi:hypothetical protein
LLFSLGTVGIISYYYAGFQKAGMARRGCSGLKKAVFNENNTLNNQKVMRFFII